MKTAAGLAIFAVGVLTGICLSELHRSRLEAHTIQEEVQRVRRFTDALQDKMAKEGRADAQRLKDEIARAERINGQ